MMDIINTINLLEECSTRDEARELLSPFTKGELLKLAKNHDIFVRQHLEKEFVLDRIVEASIGAKIKHSTLKGEPFMIVKGEIILLEDMAYGKIN